MKAANFILLHVENVATSASFYEYVLGNAPVEFSATFAMFVTPEGFKLGLWDHHGVLPASTRQTGSSEIVFSCDTDEEVDAVHMRWAQNGIHILQAPETMDFGRTFTAADPDGHRVRVYHVANEPA